MTIYAHNNLFIQNKYYNWYYQIIDKARTKNYDGYSEVHHIVPSALGGSDNPDNLVRLSFREHFLCHWILIKFVKDPIEKGKMSYALQRMTSINDVLTGKKIVASWQFEVAKRAAKDNMRGENHPNYGKKFYNNGDKSIQILDGEDIPEGFLPGMLPRSEEHRRKLSIIRRGQKHYNNGVKQIRISASEEIPEGFVPGGLPISDETRRKISESNTGKKRSNETRRNMSDKKFYNNGTKEIKLSDDKEIPEGFVPGRLPKSNETKRKMSDKMRGRKYYNNGIKNILISEDKDIPVGFVLGMITYTKEAKSL
jgi:hypothetical protein